MSKYEIEQSPIWADVREIMASAAKPVRYEYRAMIHTEKEDFPVLKLHSEDIVRDYLSTVGDQVRVEFTLGLGDYIVRLYPFKDNLEFTIKKTLLKETSDSQDTNANITIQRYKAVFLVNDNPPGGSSDIDKYDIQTLNNQDIVTVKLQLLDRSLEPLRIKTTGGIFRDVTNKQIMFNLLSAESNLVLVDGKPAADGVDIVDPDNKEVIKHVVIPHGTKVTSIPTYLQENVNGVYTASIGTYLQTYKGKKIWFVYPLYNLTRFDTNTEKAIIYLIPKERYVNVERSFNKEGDVLSIVAASDKQYVDKADTTFMNQGNGFRMPDARSYMKKPVLLTNNSAEASRGNLVHEVAVKDRKDNLNYAPVLLGGPSSNPFKEYSKLIGRSQARFTFVWENSDISLIYPGMPCKVIYVEEGELVKLNGVILNLHSLTTVQGENAMMAKLYRSVTAVSIICETKEPTRKDTTSSPPGVF